MAAQAPGLTLTDADASPHGYMRISNQASTQINLLANTPIATDLPSLTVHAQQCHATLRRFRNLNS